jgi:uncharacterized protein YcaQ
MFRIRDHAHEASSISPRKQKYRATRMKRMNRMNRMKKEKKRKRNLTGKSLVDKVARQSSRLGRRKGRPTE